MKQFSLEEYLANPSRKIVTRDGCPVRILCTDRISCHKDIIGLVMINGSEYIFTWTQQGKISPNSDTPNDLFFAPEKHEGWISIHRGLTKTITLMEYLIQKKKPKGEVLLQPLKLSGRSNYGTSR